jgi:hypothetical protein
MGNPERDERGRFISIGSGYIGNRVGGAVGELCLKLTMKKSVLLN